MTLKIRFADGTKLVLPTVQAVRLLTHDSIETQTFGNGPVTQRGVLGFTVVYESPEQRFRDAARATYEAIGFDVWGGDAVPSAEQDEFVDVIRDQIGNGHNDLTDDEIAQFRALPLDEKRRIILTAL